MIDGPKSPYTPVNRILIDPEAWSGLPQKYKMERFADNSFAIIVQQ